VILIVSSIDNIETVQRKQRWEGLPPYVCVTVEQGSEHLQPVYQKLNSSATEQAKDEVKLFSIGATTLFCTVY
jgi:hypothetical protein